MTNYRMVVIDDHELVLSGTLAELQRQYPGAELVKAQTADAVLKEVKRAQPDLVVIDLSIPQGGSESAKTETGIQLLRQLMMDYPTLNIVVQTAFPESLVRLKLVINNHEGGFAIANKSLSTPDMLKRVDWALGGVVCTSKELRTGLEVKPEWLELLNLAFQDGLQDKAIADRMNVSLRTVRNYWIKIQDALAIYPDQETDKNLRTLTGIQARIAGLID